jgi:cation transport regulator ChaC
MRSSGEPLWVFGYGSLVWRPAFPFQERRAGFIDGFARRFWQGSTDHRGVPEQPGRVATVVKESSAVCWGVVYRVAEPDRGRVLEGLDHRESGGFERYSVSVRCGDEGADRVSALMYVAAPGNPNFLGSASELEIVDQVRRCVGPSGSNVEYVLELADALEVIGARDDHVFRLAALLRGAADDETGASAGC